MAVATKKLIYYFAALSVGVFFFVSGIVDAKGFLAPIVIAVILTLLLIPLCNRFESWGLGRTLASFLNSFLVLVVSLGFFALITYQLNYVVEDWQKIKDTMAPKVEHFTQFVIDNTAYTQADWEEFKEDHSITDIISAKQGGQTLLTFLKMFLGFLGSFLLTFVYIFFLLRYRHMFKIFLLKLFPEERRKETKETIDQIAEVAQGYLMGRLILISLLAVLYSIGLGISGVSNFIIISILAAVLTLIPYLGNLIGFTLALVFGYVTQGEFSILVGIAITFTVVQFVESYLLTPYIVGDKVDVHPLFVIMVVIIGNMLWGIIGMVVAIPVLGIMNVIFMHVPKLKPFGYLLSKRE
ncbi:MAG: AI-2E family transporter [Flavobacteriaceae bacterium]|nr:AI-2E family transporter [Flavobacteriaceae bacterium]